MHGLKASIHSSLVYEALSDGDSEKSDSVPDCQGDKRKTDMFGQCLFKGEVVH